MGLRRSLAILCAKLTSSVIQIMGRGNGLTLPGYVARRIDPGILPAMAGMVRKKIIVTTGTNGKTTTNTLLSRALEAEGYRVVINRTGANMLNGITAAFVLAAGKGGCLEADYACIEVDEMDSVNVFPQLGPDVVLLTNFFRDQLDRGGEMDIVWQKLKNAITGLQEATLVINGDDIFSYSLACSCERPSVIYGISEAAFDDIPKSGIRESIFCRSCGQQLEYDFYHYGHLGVYHCPACGLSRPVPACEATGIVFREGAYAFDIDGIHIDSKARAPYNVYNTLSAYAALCALGEERGKFREAVEQFDYGNNREDIFTINNTRVQLHLAKNPIGFQQKLYLLWKDPNPKDVIIQINDEYQDGKDISWLWDVDFQRLADVGAVRIITNGSRRYEMALRLKYEDIPCEAAEDIWQPLELLTEVGTGNLYVIVNYTGLYRTNHMLRDMQEQARQKGEGAS